MRNIQLCIFGCLSLISILSTKAEEPGSYRSSRALLVENKKDKISTDDFLAIGETRSKIQCAEKCVDSLDCFSFFYNKYTKVCQTHGKGLQLVNSVFEEGNGFRYYQLSGGLVGHPCVTSNGCFTNNSECGTAGVCRCAAGYSFQPDTKTCETDCTRYGDTFEIFQSRAIDGNNEETVTEVTLKECLQLCVNASSYTCISVDWRLDTCWLQSVDALDVPGNYEVNFSITYAQRNCA